MQLSRSKLINYSLFTVLISTIFVAAAPLIAVFVDGLFISNLLGVEPFNAINLVLPISNFVMVLTLICNMGGSLMSAKAMAVGDTKTQNKYFTASLVSAVAIAWISIIVLGVGMDWVSSRLCPTETGAAYVKEYLSVILVYFLFLPFITTFNNMVQIEGYPKLATKIVLAANIINIFLDFVFIYLLGWGLKGAAWATVIAGVFNVVLYLPYFFSERCSFRLVKLDFKEKEIFKKMFAHGIGFNLFYIMTNLLLLFSNNLIVNKLGTDGLLVYGVCTQIQSLTLCIAVGISIGGISMISYLLGTDSQMTLLEIFRKITKVNATLYFILFLIMAVFPTLAPSAFGVSDPSILEHCRYPFICYFIYYIFFALIAVHTTLSYQLMGHIGAKALYVLGLGAVAYILMVLFSLIDVNLLWLGFPIAGLIMYLAMLSYGYRRYLKDKSLTRFSLFEKYPKDVRVHCVSDYDGKAIPEVIESLNKFQGICELPESTRNGVEKCCTEFCDVIKSHHAPLFTDVFNITFTYKNDKFIMSIKSPGAPFSTKLQSDGAEGMPDSIKYTYQFGLNITNMCWKL